MVIKGLYTQFDETKIPPHLLSAVEATIRMVRMLEKIEGTKFIKDERLFADSLTIDFIALDKVADGRLYLELPAAVRTEALVTLATIITRGRTPYGVSHSRHYWSTLSDDQYNGTTPWFRAQLALFSDSRKAPLVHYTDMPVHTLMDAPRTAQMLQDRFAHISTIAPRAATHRDFLVWYIMDCLRNVPVEWMPLIGDKMWVPATRVRTVQGSLVAGCCGVVDGKAYLAGLHPSPPNKGAYGIGISLGLANAR